MEAVVRSLSSVLYTCRSARLVFNKDESAPPRNMHASDQRIIVIENCYQLMYQFRDYSDLIE